MEIFGVFKDLYFVLVLSGLIIGGIMALYILWHVIFMVFFPLGRVLFRKETVKEPIFYSPGLGFTLADGGEKLEKKEEKGNE